VDEVISGICDRYSKLKSVRVVFREEFTHYAQDRGEGPWRGTPVVADGIWTVDLPQDAPLSRAREKFEISFLKGASAFINVPSNVTAGSTAYVWDGKQGRKLQQFVTSKENRTGSFGWIQEGKSADRGDWQIQSFLFFWHRYEDVKALREGLSNPKEPVEVVGEENVRGVPCVVLERQGRQHNYRWRMAVAPERDFVLMRLQIWSPRLEQKPFEWIEVEKIRRFGDLWFPVEGEYATKRPVSDRYWEHHFAIKDVKAGAPFDVSVLDVDWPSNTTVFDIPAKIQYRVMPNGSIPERTEALDKALALARASRPPPVSGGPGTTTILVFVLGALVLAALGWWGWRVRRRQV
jgi:hypothetical protein